MPCFLPPYKIHSTRAALTAEEVTPWGVALLNAPYAWVTIRGQGVVVAVIDTGVWVKHPDLGENLLPLRDYLGVIEPEGDRKTPDHFWTAPAPGGSGDENGHGCASGDTYVYTSFCGVETMEKLWQRLNGGDQSTVFPDNVYTLALNPRSQKVERCQVVQMHRIPVNESIVKLTAEDGTILKLTPWHPTFAYRDRRVVEVRADDVECGDLLLAPAVAVPITTDYKEYDGVRITEDIAWCIGAVLGNGSICVKPEYNSYRVDMSDPEQVVHKKMFDTLGPLGTKTYGPVASPGRALRGIVWGKFLTEWFADVCGVSNDKCSTITVPGLIAKSPLSVICAFLAGYLDTDGTVRKYKAQVIFSTISKPMVDTLVPLLQSLGIRTGVSELVPKANEKVNYQVRIGAACARLLVKMLLPYMVKPHKIARARGILRIPSKRWRPCIVGDLGTKEVVRVERQEANETFYDFTVDRLHNYLAGIGGFSFIHNTHVAGTIAAPANGLGVVGVAPKAHILPCRVLNAYGIGDDYAIYAACLDCAREFTLWKESGGEKGLPIAVANLSLGSTQPSKWLELGTKAMYDAGIVVICAAGNSGPGDNTVNYPARYPHTVAVAAVDSNQARGWFSSTGPDLYLSAPGVAVTSTWKDGGEATLSGTSMAAPHVAGLAALVQAEALDNGFGDFLRPDEVIARLKKWARDLGELGHDPEFGWGLPVWPSDEPTPEEPSSPAPEYPPEAPASLGRLRIGDPWYYPPQGEAQPISQAPVLLYGHTYVVALDLFNVWGWQVWETPEHFRAIDPDRKREIIFRHQASFRWLVDGQESRVNYDGGLPTVYGRRMIPLRQVLEGMGLRLEWDPTDKSITMFE